MRQAPHPKRSRGRGGNRRLGVSNRNQTFDSNGPEVRIRGNASQLNEKYLALARDAAAVGDRVLTESYLQHAEHYFRILNAFSEDGEPESTRGRELATESGPSAPGDMRSFGSGPQPEVSPPSAVQTETADFDKPDPGDLAPAKQSVLVPKVGPIDEGDRTDAQPETSARRRWSGRQSNGVERSSANRTNGDARTSEVTVTVVRPGTNGEPSATPRRRRSNAVEPDQQKTLTLGKKTEKPED